MKKARTAWLVLFGTLFVAFIGCKKELPDQRYPEDQDPPQTKCEESNVCHVWGWCTLVDGECRPTTKEQCRGSLACQKGGLCSLEPYVAKCVARGDDCKGSTWCEVYNLCTAQEGVCK